MNSKKIFLFCLLSYFLCWTLAFGYFASGGELHSVWFLAVATGCMFTPGIAALLVQKVIYNENMDGLGLTFTFNKWFIVAWLFPVVLIILTLFASSLIPGAELSSGEEYLREQISNQASPQLAEQAIQDLKEFGLPLPLILAGGGILVGLVSGPTVNAIAAFGEELGWRGFLQKELNPLGFWRSSILVGILWGFWHLPLIFYGYNYPDHPIGGIFMMTLLAVMLSPIFAQLRLLARSVFAAAIVHGVFNALAGLPLLLISGGSPMTTGVTGVAGILVLLLLNIGLFFYRKEVLFSSN